MDVWLVRLQFYGRGTRLNRENKLRFCVKKAGIGGGWW